MNHVEAGLKQAKPTITSAVETNREPPDKRRKMDVDAGVEAWDDDFDLILTQNMNQLDSLVASSFRSADQLTNATACSANQSTVCRPVANTDVRKSVLPVANSVPNIHASSVFQTSTCSTRFVGRGSLHSRSVDSQTRPLIHTSISTSAVRQVLNADRNGGCVLSPPISVVETTESASLLQKGGYLSQSGGSSYVQLPASHPSYSSIMDSSGETVLGPEDRNGAKLLKVASSSSVAGGELSMLCIVEECEYYKTQYASLQKEQYAKDGQIKIIREKFSHAQSELSRLKQEALKNIERRMEEKSRKEIDLEQDIERLNTDLQFKEHELAELRDYLKKTERKSTSTDNFLPSALPADKQHIPKSPSMSRFLGNFESLQLKSTSPSKATLSGKVTASVMSNLSIKDAYNENNKTALVGNRPCKMKLAVPNSKGRLLGPSLVKKLLNSQSDPLSALSTNGAIRSSKTPDRETSTLSPATDLSKGHCLFQPSSESVRLANAGFHLLLTSESARSDGPNQPLGLLASDNPCSVLLLPQIEDVLKAHQLPQLRLCTPIPGRNEASAALIVEESSAMRKSVLSLHNCLCRLHHLVSCCRHIRLAIIGCGDRGAKCTCAPSADVRPAGGGEKSDDIYSNTIIPSAASTSSSRFNLHIEKVINKCQLMDILISFSNPAQDRPWKSTSACLCLNILVEVADSCDGDHLKRFLPLLESDLLLNCLSELGVEDCESPNVHFNIVWQSLKLLCTLVRSHDIVKNICSIGQECILSALYNLSSVGYPETWNSTQVGIVHELMISILASVIANHVDGACLLLQSNCQCSSKVVKDLILVLRTQYDIFSLTNSTPNLSNIRKGLAVLHSLAAAADASGGRSFLFRCAEVNNEYLTLMFDIVHLFQQKIGVPEVELNNVWSILPGCLIHFVVEEDAYGKMEKDVPLPIDSGHASS